MGSLLFVAVRWLVAGVALAVGVEVGKFFIKKAEEEGITDNLSEGVDQTLKDIKHTWTGRQNKDETEQPPRS